MKLLRELLSLNEAKPAGKLFKVSWDGYPDKTKPEVHSLEWFTVDRVISKEDIEEIKALVVGGKITFYDDENSITILRLKDGSVNEAKNYLGDAEYETWAGWKRAIKAKFPTAWIEGDVDIAEAFMGPQPFKRGETYSVGEWGGDKGSIFKDATKKDVSEAEESLDGPTPNGYVRDRAGWRYTVSKGNDGKFELNARKIGSALTGTTETEKHIAAGSKEEMMKRLTSLTGMAVRESKQSKLDDALEAMLKDIENGREFPDVSWRIATKFGVPQTALERMYDEHCKNSLKESVNQTALEIAQKISDGNNDLEIDDESDPNTVVITDDSRDFRFEIRIITNAAGIKIETRASNGDNDHESDRDFKASASIKELKDYIEDSADMANDYFDEED